MQKLPIGLSEAWDYFSTPVNLADITPAHMGFKITSEVPGKMYTGQIISYKVAPLPGIKTNWITEITHIEKNKFFVDEQRFGPYSMWHHEHHFEEVDGGIMMTDKVSYKIPFGFLGRIAQSLFVKKQLTGIFEHRVKVLKEKFGE
ncbi:MAG: SRPBCC family protein [Ekhidna sp.]|nr:SRPBCC family protein [Ekhidna sp.]MBC6409149.1 SRPBCC family protein [Ekhidna sp.]MBC6426644.1 SRPBCC family protein [Ekhidna sp.]